MTQTNYMTWKGSCQVCGALRKNGAGLFCANFLLARGPFPPCNNVWCGKCYQPATDSPFPIQPFLRDEDDEESDVVAEDVKRHDHRRGRDGDHLMGVPFQCDLCHFRNVSGRNPCWNSPVDCNALTGIRQANLDVMWARASSTVATNLSRQRKDYNSAMARYPLRQPLPLLGFEEVEDKVGMTAALITLNASLRQGKYADHLQPDSARKTRSWYNNAHMSGASYLTNTMYAKDEKKLHATTSPTAGEWYVRFTQGMKLRTGQIRKRELMLSLQNNQ